MTQGAGSAAFNFGGGTLGAIAPWSSSVNMNLSGIGGAGTVDTTGGSISLSGNLTGSGGLTKIGPGNLMLSGINTLGGNLIVDGGTLQVPGGGLAPANQYIGYSATGSFAQSGGTNSVSGSLYIGNNSGSSGSLA